MGRRTKTLLPTSTKLLQPKLVKPQAVLKELRQRKSRQKLYYDRHTATHRPLAVGDTVMIRTKGKWEPATVIAIPVWLALTKIYLCSLHGYLLNNQ